MAQWDHHEPPLDLPDCVCAGLLWHRGRIHGGFRQLSELASDWHERIRRLSPVRHAAHPHVPGRPARPRHRFHDPDAEVAAGGHSDVGRVGGDFRPGRRVGLDRGDPGAHSNPTECKRRVGRAVRPVDRDEFLAAQDSVRAVYRVVRLDGRTRDHLFLFNAKINISNASYSFELIIISFRI